VRGPDVAYKLVFRPLTGIATASTTELPSLVNARDTSVHNPEFSRDGRYLAFIRRKTTGNDGTGRLYVWDTQTQLLLNPDGVYGLTASASEGAIALEVTKVFRPRVDVGGVLAQFALARESYVDMVVQQVVGTTTVLGRRAPRLKLVGRVSLGRHNAGRRLRQVRWNRMVGRRRLPRGEYLLTLRSLTRKAQVRDQAAPVRIRFR
jgi:hypothetical protein